MALPDRRLDGARLWRLDHAVLADDAAKEILRAGVSGTFSGARDPSQEWDTLKAQWQHWAKECGRNVRLRLTHELNETLRKIRIVKAGAPLTPTTREFLGVLRARYDRIFLQTTQKVHIYPQDSMFRDTPDLTRFLKSRRSLNGPNEYAMSVCMRDGSVSEDGTDIDRCFLEYFSHLFAESDQVTDSSAVIRELESLCAGVPKLPEEASANLTKKASAAEVFSILRSLKVGSAPGPDGLPTEFYKELWPEIGAGLVAMINGILNSGKVPESLAEGKLILLPKEATAGQVERRYSLKRLQLGQGMDGNVDGDAATETTEACADKGANTPMEVTNANDRASVSDKLSDPPDADGADWQLSQTLRQRKKQAQERHSLAALQAQQKQMVNSQKMGPRGQKLPPLPKDDYKIVIRPHQGLPLKAIAAPALARAIIETCDNQFMDEKFILRINRGSNIVIVSTKYSAMAELVRKIQQLVINGRPHPVRVYVATGEEALRGVATKTANQAAQQPSQATPLKQHNDQQQQGMKIKRDVSGPEKDGWFREALQTNLEIQALTLRSLESELYFSRSSSGVGGCMGCGETAVLHTDASSLFRSCTVSTGQGFRGQMPSCSVNQGGPVLHIVSCIRTAADIPRVQRSAGLSALTQCRQV
ncbi:hypothetical protein MTO96_024347 [Rhipicephalus appendiculatus]